MESFIRHDAENMKRYYETTGFVLKPVMLEERFLYKMDGNRTIISGVADRVDLEMNCNGSFTGRFIIYDYKKGGVKGIKECIEGSDFQLPLYYPAFINILKDAFGIEQPDCLALLYYSIEKLQWNGFIRKDIKKALFEGKKGPRNIPEKPNMELVLSWSEKEAMKVIERIRQGCFMLPKQCPATEYTPCTYSGMCRYESTRISRKAGV